jgi:copper-containing nitrite reductase
MNHLKVSFIYASAFLLFLFAWFAHPASAQHQMHDMAMAEAPLGPAVDIVRDPAEVPATVGSRPAGVVKIDLTAMEVVGTLDPASGTTYRYWTFNGKVPGPMLRVRVGDTVEVTVHNSANSHMVHSVDFHAAIGPGGGAALSQVLPGQQKTFTFIATTPGLFVYHCGTPMISDHIANGMYGMILVEPAGGLPAVDHEYYVMQGEIYTSAPKGKAGLQTFSEDNLMKESASYFVFNGAVDALTKKHPMVADVGQTVRLFFGDAGPNATSSLHVVGEIFTRDFQFGSLQSPPIEGVQTASVPAGGAAILELKMSQPGQFNIMDHAMARMGKGLVATINVRGNDVAGLMREGAAAGGDSQPILSAVAPGADRVDLETASPVARNSQEAVSPRETRKASARTTKDEGRNGTAASGAARIYGCFTMSGAVAKLTLFHSSKSLYLEPVAGLLSEKPLAFGNSINKLVEVTGQVDHGGHLYGGEWFEVKSIEPLAPTCNPTQSLAELRDAAREETRLSATAVSIPQGSRVVTMADMAFTPAEITVALGDTVVWKNTSSTTHNVVADVAQASNVADVQLPRRAKPFSSGYLQPGQSYQHTFTTPGIYHYVCTLHEYGGMKAVVIVKATSSVHMARAEAPAHQ